MYLQQRISSFILFFHFAIVLSTIGLPVTAVRYMENSKNELGENGPTAIKAGNDNINTASVFYGKHNLRSMLIAPKDYQPKLHSKFPLSRDLMEVLLEYEDEGRSKPFDDYGHMRFGKRGGEEQFDDYGHMRFGRSV